MLKIIDIKCGGENVRRDVRESDPAVRPPAAPWKHASAAHASNATRAVSPARRGTARRAVRGSWGSATTPNCAGMGFDATGMVRPMRRIMMHATRAVAHPDDIVAQLAAYMY